ncbi:hypothetical protein CQW23_25910 [Capsicum baccatum]|uniref:Ubiquitin-like protease family profile domain-containing protein n=1 Tax=Capsicum baccatum TaxID=33114 RepID=A0A2G2VMB6_CAPBA|nr:hypothetical protein CQW23_25910 [Capsicum baccatum]
MNSDFGSSFSLGASQLESIKESHEVVNFISGSFDYEFVDFGENRLKHKNDPQIMKKLWQKHSKDKKKKMVLRKGDPAVLKVKLPPREEKLSKLFSEMNFPSNELATQDASAKIDEVADMEMTLIKTIKGFSPRADQPWHLVEEVFVSINCDGAFHWILKVIALKDRCIYVYDSMASS